MDRGRIFVYDQVEVRKRRKLPHWHADQGLYFLTYRLGDSLPVQHERRIEWAANAERRRLYSEGLSVDDVEEELRRFVFSKTQPVLDKGYGSCILKESVAASEVVRCWNHMNGRQYDLVSWCIMPNHVHNVVKLRAGADVSDVVESWKSVTTRNINKALARKATLGQDDYFDVLIRDERQLRQTVKYVLDNPLKAGLRDWKWTGIDSQLLVSLV